MLALFFCGAYLWGRTSSIACIMTSQTTQILRISRQSSTWLDDEVVVEGPLALRYRYTDSEAHPLSVTMRTPGADRALGLGLLFAENIINTIQDVHATEAHSEIAEQGISTDVVTFTLASHVAPPTSSSARTFISSSSCGLCGKTSFDASFPAEKSTLLTDVPTISHNVLFGMSEQVRAAQPTFARTGGIHAAALFDWGGNLLAACEDIGRHNALDKLLGLGLEAGWWPNPNAVLFLSGRLSYELMQKAIRAGLTCVVGISAPSSLAVRMAREHGVTLVGFMRDKRCNIYTHPHRIRI